MLKNSFLQFKNTNSRNLKFNSKIVKIKIFYGNRENQQFFPKNIIRDNNVNIIRKPFSLYRKGELLPSLIIFKILYDLKNNKKVQITASQKLQKF